MKNNLILKKGPVFIIVLLMANNLSLYGQTIEFGKSYLNVTKGSTGGTIENGDIIEIRATITVRAGVYDSCAFYDFIPSGTSFVSGSIRVLTNEGKVYKQFTDAIADDCGYINGTAVRINLGYSATNSASAVSRGRVGSTHKPSNYGSACIMLATYRVRITASLNSNINTGGGWVTYQNGLNPVQTFLFPANYARVSTNIAPSTVTGNNFITTEYNGSFGSGKPRNRGTSTYILPAYSAQVLDIANPNDNSYAIVNNSSTRSNYTTVNSWPKPDNSSPTHRVFTLWDIVGDHTGAASITNGNAAADTVANSNAGYMLIVNSAFRNDSVIQQTVSGLCPNTYYEISCWFRNICSKCGSDSNGTAATNASGPPYYIPTGSGDSSGVAPNIVFEINGIDYYSTGNISYTGQWVKKGFVFLTGASQTSFTLKLFNNAPSGGGNDWAMDDMLVSAADPQLKFSTFLNPYICYGNPLTLYDTVRSAFNNLVYYVWQRSTDGGLTWTSAGTVMGPVTPEWNGTCYEYVSSHTILPAYTTQADSADQYRVWVASTPTNLSNSSCRFTEPGNIITIHSFDCGIPLDIQLLTFEGKMQQQNALLQWTITNDNTQIFFQVERSIDGQNFSAIGFAQSEYVHGGINSAYTFTDPDLKPGKYYYRIRISNAEHQVIYSKTIQLVTEGIGFYITSLPNPFKEELRMDIYSDQERIITVQLFNSPGSVVLRKTFSLTEGINKINIQNMGGITGGVYFIKVQARDGVIQRKALKTSY